MRSPRGVPPPAGRALDGIDVLPILEGRLPELERTFFWRLDMTFRKQKVVRKGQWKYVRDGNTDLLFDLSADIGERSDVGYRFPATVAELRALLAEWEKNLGSAARP